MRRLRLVLVTGALVATIAFGGQANAQTVTAGAFCSPAGATGVTVTGLALVCTTTATDSQLRWRQADPTTTTTAAASSTTTTAATSSTTAVTTASAPTTTTTRPPAGVAGVATGVLDRTG